MSIMENVKISVKNRKKEIHTDYAFNPSVDPDLPAGEWLGAIVTDLVVRILPYTEADLDRLISTEFFITETMEQPGFPFISNDLHAKQVTIVTGNSSMFGFSGNIEIEMTDISDLNTMPKTIKQENDNDNFIEIIYTITDR